MKILSVKTWLYFVIIISYVYVICFTSSGMLSISEPMSKDDKEFWTDFLLLTNFIYCCIALIHLFGFDRRNLLITHPNLSRYSSLLLTICPLLAAAFDPLKSTLLKWHILNEKMYFFTGVISLFIIVSAILAISLWLLSLWGYEKHTAK